MEMEQWDTATHSHQESSNVNAVQQNGDSSYHQNQHNYTSNTRNHSVNNNRNYQHPHRRNQQNYNNSRHNNNYRRQQYNNNNHYGGYRGQANRNRTRYEPRNKQNHKQYQYQPKHNTQQHTHTHDTETQSNDVSIHPPNTFSTPHQHINRFRNKKKFKRQIENDFNFKETDDTNPISTSNNTVDTQHKPKTQYVDESETQIRYNDRYNPFQNNTTFLPHHSKPKPNTLDENLSERAKEMILQLKKQTYDCMVCQSCIGKKGRVWKCLHCYTMFHITCVNKWARAKEEKDAETEQRASKASHMINKLRCPACNFIDTEFTFNEYKCFCGKIIFDHEYRSSYNHTSSIPHSCGDICGKKRGTHCPHSCRGECHPGPCIPCKLPSNRKSQCACGKMEYSLLCGETETKQRLCTQICDKVLKCGNHSCEQQCHESECKPCVIKSKQECFCGKHKSLKPCGTGVEVRIKDESEQEMIRYKYPCNKVCNKQLSCGHHRCILICHNGACSVCPRQIEKPTRCACTKTVFAKVKRTSCLDALPVCKKKCGLKLACGQHVCRKPCHDSKCALCARQIKKKCRCGASEKKYKCHDYQKKLKQFVSNSNDPFVDQDSWIKCGKKCKRVKSCGKHTCAEVCCRGRSMRTFFEGHRCAEFCSEALSCGKHSCSSYCHRGKCNPCGVTYRNGLECACGTVFVAGPFQCGTKYIPQCNQTCGKVLPCGHSCTAKCHHGDCGACIRICSKRCNSHGLMVHNIPCHVDNRSCGNPCEKVLDCGVHKCMRMCHTGVCGENMPQDKGCGQICARILRCGHKCMRKCHANGGNRCNVDQCKAQITVKCKCGRTSKKQYCKGRTQYQLKAVPCDKSCSF